MTFLKFGVSCGIKLIYAIDIILGYWQAITNREEHQF